MGPRVSRLHVENDFQKWDFEISFNLNESSNESENPHAFILRARLPISIDYVIGRHQKAFVPPIECPTRVVIDTADWMNESQFFLSYE